MCTRDDPYLFGFTSLDEIVVKRDFADEIILL